MDEALAQVLWTSYFIKCQGFNTASNTVYQDNKSTVVLEHKEKEAGSKRTKHVKVRHFLLKIR